MILNARSLDNSMNVGIPSKSLQCLNFAIRSRFVALVAKQTLKYLFQSSKFGSESFGNAQKNELHPASPIVCDLGLLGGSIANPQHAHSRLLKSFIDFFRQENTHLVYSYNPQLVSVCETNDGAGLNGPPGSAPMPHLAGAYETTHLSEYMFQEQFRANNREGCPEDTQRDREVCVRPRSNCMTENLFFALRRPNLWTMATPRVFKGV